jgi:hypothetical protein
VHIRKIGYLAAPAQYQAFVTAHQELLTALRNCLSTNTSSQAAQDEVTATVSAIRQIAPNGVSP